MIVNFAKAVAEALSVGLFLFAFLVWVGIAAGAL